MTNPYVVQTGTSRGRIETTIDVDRFASDLVHALVEGKVDAHPIPFAEDVAPKWRSKIRISGAHDNGGGLDLIIQTDNPSPRHNGRVEISFYVNDVQQRDLDGSTVMPSITVSTDRDIKGIANDVVRRGILLAITPANRLRERAKENNERRGKLDDAVAKLEARFPGLLVVEKANDGLTAHVRVQSQGSLDYFYLWGRIDHDGRFTHERMQHMSPEFFRDFLALIGKHYPSTLASAYLPKPKRVKGNTAR